MMRRFTGWHMIAVLAAFFGVVITVNFIMARYAIATFGGTVVENSYVASQNYNRWLAAADRQARLGWTPNVTLDAGRHLGVSVAKDGVLLNNLDVTGTAVHPLGRGRSIPLTFRLVSTGGLRSVEALPVGRWKVRLSLRRGADVLKRLELVQ